MSVCWSVPQLYIHAYSKLTHARTETHTHKKSFPVSSCFTGVPPTPFSTHLFSLCCLFCFHKSLFLLHLSVDLTPSGAQFATTKQAQSSGDLQFDLKTTLFFLLTVAGVLFWGLFINFFLFCRYSMCYDVERRVFGVNGVANANQNIMSVLAVSAELHCYC